jgi:hypothetical protein
MQRVRRHLDCATPDCDHQSLALAQLRGERLRAKGERGGLAHGEVTAAAFHEPVAQVHVGATHHVRLRIGTRARTWRLPERDGEVAARQRAAEFHIGLEVAGQQHVLGHRRGYVERLVGTARCDRVVRVARMLVGPRVDVGGQESGVRRLHRRPVGHDLGAGQPDDRRLRRGRPAIRRVPGSRVVLELDHPGLHCLRPAAEIVVEPRHDHRLPVLTVCGRGLVAPLSQHESSPV